MRYHQTAATLLALALLAGAPARAATDTAPADAASPQSTLPQSAAPPAAPAQPVAIDGFRSAKFGMTEAEVRKAIEADFRLSGAAVRTAANAVQRTSLLTITVADLVPDAGRAAVAYVFGYRTKRLIEVDVTWSAATEPSIKPETLLHCGQTLQAYFQNETFPAGHAVSNAMLGDGGLLLFRGDDPDGHTVALILSGPVHSDPKQHRAQMTPSVLRLTYAADPAHPDVYQLPKGTF